MSECRLCGFPTFRKGGHAIWCGDPAIFGEAEYRAAPTHDDRCGTYAGMGAHTQRGEAPCEPCREARCDYQNAVRAARRREADKRRVTR